MEMSALFMRLASLLFRNGAWSDGVMARTVCLANGMQCPQIVMSCSGRHVNLW